VYRVYPGQADEMLLEISAFRVEDNPYEDLAEGYYILNTNISNSREDHDDMLKNRKAAAYFDPWKFKIERLAKGDVIFLYQSSVGIVALGEADGKLIKLPYHGKLEHPDEEYFMKLQRFQTVSLPLTAAESQPPFHGHDVRLGRGGRQSDPKGHSRSDDLGVSGGCYTAFTFATTFLVVADFSRCCGQRQPEWQPEYVRSVAVPRNQTPA
jgi:hypothetical protein